MPEQLVGKILLNGVGPGTWVSPEFVERGDANAVIVESFPHGASPSATLTVLDSAGLATGFNDVVDSNGKGLAAFTAYDKRLIVNVLDFVKVKLVVTSGTWTVRVTPVNATNQATITATVSGSVDQGNPNAGGANAWFVQSGDGALASVGTTTDLEATGDGSAIAILKRLRTLLSGTLATSSADGAHTALGATGDAEATGNGTVIAILKRLRTLLAGGLPAALTAGGNLKTAILEALPAGANLIGLVGVSATTSVTGQTLHFDSSGDNTVQTIKASAGKVYSLEVQNPNTSDAYIQLFDEAGAITVGTTVPKQSYFVPAGGAMDKTFTVPLQFANSIKYACTTTPTGGGNPTTGLVVNAGFI